MPPPLRKAGESVAPILQMGKRLVSRLCRGTQHSRDRAGGVPVLTSSTVLSTLYPTVLSPPDRERDAGYQISDLLNGLIFKG